MIADEILECENCIKTLSSIYILPRNVLDCIDDFISPTLNLVSCLTPSTLTAQGFLSNVLFHERDLIKTLTITEKIHLISSNYGEIKSIDYKEIKKTKKKTNRGRKQKERIPSKRKIQGNGKHFNSQVTFQVQSLLNQYKYYKCKIYRNGTIEIPGGLFPDMRDIIYVAKIVKDKMSEHMKTDVKILNLYAIMRNYKFELTDKTTRLNIQKLYKILLDLKENKHFLVDNIYEIKINIERYPGLLVTFSTPIPKNLKKKTTIKMFRSGKINIDGVTSTTNADYYYRKMIKILDRYKDLIIYKPTL